MLRSDPCCVLVIEPTLACTNAKGNYSGPFREFPTWASSHGDRPITFVFSSLVALNDWILAKTERKQMGDMERRRFCRAPPILRSWACFSWHMSKFSLERESAPYQICDRKIDGHLLQMLMCHFVHEMTVTYAFYADLQALTWKTRFPSELGFRLHFRLRRHFILLMTSKRRKWNQRSVLSENVS